MNNNINNFKEFAELLDDRVAELGVSKKDNALTEIRTAIYNDCKNAQIEGAGFYKLDVPTGGGKTYASLRFALSAAIKYNKKRIIIVLPFLSIIEQNAADIRKVLEPYPDAVFESHSNVVNESEEDASGAAKIEIKDAEIDKAFDTYDHPIIFTTMVQFLENIYGGGTNGLRRFHNLGESVIIFDEIQALPLKCTFLFNMLVDYLGTMCGSIVVLSSATISCLDNLPEHKPFSLPPCKNIISREFPAILTDRVEYIHKGAMTITETATFASEILNNSFGLLVVVNTKSSCKKLYEEIEKRAAGLEMFYLSTNLCAEHRSDIICKVKKALTASRNGGKKVCLVSTQLIEAGVNLDFPVAVRAAAGVDSIIQTAGRCNRNALDHGAIIYIIELLGENLNNLEEIDAGKEWTLARWKTYNYPLEKAKKKFYDWKYGDGAYKNPLEYKFTIDDIKVNQLNLLSVNSPNNFTKESYGFYVNGWQRVPAARAINCAFKQAFRTASKNFAVIENYAETAAVVPYGEGAKFVDALNRGDFSVLKRCARYTVNTMSRRPESFLKKIETKYGVIWAAYLYDKIFGLFEPPEGEALFVEQRR
jgi:CRISPR-associated helicase Cas3